MKRPLVDYTAYAAIWLPFPILAIVVGFGTWGAAAVSFGVPLVLILAVGLWARSGV
jgi:uncharacterized membrane protein (DUF2068 family)